jgi:serine/threonine protein kinase
MATLWQRYGNASPCHPFRYFDPPSRAPVPVPVPVPVRSNGSRLDDSECSFLESWLVERCQAAADEYESAQRSVETLRDLGASLARTNNSGCSQTNHGGSQPNSPGSSLHRGSSANGSRASASKPAKGLKSFLKRVLGSGGKSKAKGGGGGAAEAAGGGSKDGKDGGDGRGGKRATFINLDEVSASQRGRAMLSNIHGLTPSEQQTIAASLGDSAISPVMRRALIDPRALVIEEMLGTGSSGVVLAGRYHGTPVAVKQLHRKLLQRDHLEYFKAECELLLSLRHPNIVQLIGGCWAIDSPAVLMVMERCKGTLQDKLLDLDAPLPMGSRLSILLGVARALSYLHAQEPPIMHRDLKPENVLLMDDDLVPKVSDFGSSREAAKLSTTLIGTPLFAAPEVLSLDAGDGSSDAAAAYGLPADIWSYGCVIACVYLRCQWPYPHEVIAGVRFRDLAIAVSSGAIVPNLPPRTSPLGRIGWSCCQLSPAVRPTFLQLADELTSEVTSAWARDYEVHGEEPRSQRPSSAHTASPPSPTPSSAAQRDVAVLQPPGGPPASSAGVTKVKVALDTPAPPTTNPKAAATPDISDASTSTAASTNADAISPNSSLSPTSRRSPVNGGARAIGGFQMRQIEVNINQKPRPQESHR